jgi:F-type H+-transporting ATPase subunit b
MHAIIHLLAAEHEGDITQTPSKFWPESYEIIYGTIASVLIFAALYKFAGPLVKKGMAARTAKIQAELDGGESDRTAADAEAAQIRSAKGDIAAERARILAEADTQAAAVLEDGAARLAAEVADLEARGDADIAASGGRVEAELRAEIARLSSAAVDHVVTGSLDDATQQELIESFISRVGASS